MRLFIVAGVSCLASACLDEVHGIREAEPATSNLVRVDAALPVGVAAGCYALRTVDTSGKNWLDVGDPTAHFATRAAAEAAGQVCGDVVERVASCGPGLEHEAFLVLTDLFKEDGTVVSQDDYQNPCPDPESCRLEFPCEAGAENVVEFNLLIMRDAKQGFFDIFVLPESAHEVSEMCVTIAVEGGNGETTWQQKNICSSQYGGNGGSISYIGTCDAEAPAAKVHMWIESITGRDASAQFVNPCPATGYDTTKACTVAASCVENNDVTVDIAPTLGH